MLKMDNIGGEAEQDPTYIYVSRYNTFQKLENVNGNCKSEK